MNVAGQASWGMNSWYLDNTSEGGDTNSSRIKDNNNTKGSTLYLKSCTLFHGFFSGLLPLKLSLFLALKGDSKH